jgi:hypothetical protein
MMRIVSLIVALLAASAFAPDADANRRTIRVDGFGTWDVYDDPNPICFGWSASSTLLLGPGLVFSGRDNPAHLTDTYCQVPTPGTLNEASFFYPDETGLAAMFGENPGDRVTAKRYSLLDQPRFSGDATGFQWTFYYFPGGGTIVGLYGLDETVLDSTSYISYNGTRVWDAGRDGYDGQYFCFDGVRYQGIWDGELDSNSACILMGFRIFRGRFE